MGCGSSSANGRDQYATLTTDAEPLTPLVNTEEDLPRLNSFIAPVPPETPPESKKPKVSIPKPAPLPPSTTLHVPKSPRKPPSASGQSAYSSHPGQTQSTAGHSRSIQVPGSPTKKSKQSQGFSSLKPPPDQIKATPSLAYQASGTGTPHAPSYNQQGRSTSKPTGPSSSSKSPKKQRKTTSAIPTGSHSHNQGYGNPNTPDSAVAFSSSFPADPAFDFQQPPKESSVTQQQQRQQQQQQQQQQQHQPPHQKQKKKVPESPAPPSLSASVEGHGLAPPPLLDGHQPNSGHSNKQHSKGGPPAVVEPKEKKKKKRKSKAGMPPQRSVSIQETPQPSSSSGMRFDELYRLRGVLGTGAFSTVREGYHRSSSSTTFAVKCVNRKKLSEEDEAALLDEVAILKELQHMHIIRLYDFFVESSTYYLVMERMSGGELFDRIVAKAYYNEKEARDVCKIVLEAVEYCHQNHVAHRDLKPENLLLLSEDDDSTVKIADFGFAKKVYSPQSLTTQCGTPGYVAPEILEGIPYDNRADMWSVGVILYILLGGYPPFIENNQRDLFRKIRRGEYEFHEEYWGTVSTDAKKLISHLLTVDPSRRLTAKDALDNKWICENDAQLANKDLGKNLQALTAFNGKRKFKAAVSTVMAVNKLQSLGRDFLQNLS